LRPEGPHYLEQQDDMEFTLTYRGPLKANAGPREKQKIRRVIHQQLRTLWGQNPLAMLLASKPNYYLVDHPPAGWLSIIRPLCGFRLAPLVTPDLYLIAELTITFLRPEAPGSLITQGGDIDNRIKTLLDALRIPKDSKELPAGDVPGQHEDPFSCLLEDDNLVTRLAVTTDRLLEPVSSPSEVLLLIRVLIKRTIGTMENLTLG